jgi:TonB-dependent starch-binding outer membrane protein SusC
MLPKPRLAATRFVAPAIAVACLAMSGPPELAAQATGVVRGQVIEAATQRPLEGALITVVGAGVSTLTNEQGNYLLTGVPAGERTVRVQLIGYGQLERRLDVAAGQTVTANFELGETAIQLGEVVVTGQGRARQRRELATTISVVSAADMEMSPAVSLDQALQGRVAGATVNATSAQPGTAGLINFRGVSSVFGSQTPVIYVDGVRMDNAQATTAGTGGEQSSALSELLTSDIERIEVTRGGAASTLFGSDAATGVIQIFTKRGQSGAPRFQVRIEQGVDVPELKYILDSQRIYEEEVANGDLPRNYLKNEFFQTGWVQNYSLNVSGGSDAVTYHVSARVQDGEGVQPKNASNLFVTRRHAGADLRADSRITFSGSYTRTQFGRLYNGTAIADPLTAFEVGDAMWLTGASTFAEAMEQFLMPDIDEEVSRFLFSTTLRYQPVDIFQTRVTVGIDRRSSLNRIYEPIGWIVASSSDGQGAVYRYNRDFNSVTMEAAGSLSYPETTNLRNTLSFGVQGFRDDLTTVYARGYGFALPGAPEVDEAGDINASESNRQVFNGGVFMEDQLGLWDRLFLNVGLRVDANTAFGDRVATKAYPKVGAAFLVSDQPGVRDAIGNWVNELKLRAAYGQTGKFPPPFLRDRTYSAASFRGEAAPRFDNPGNLDLGPEITSTLEVGFDAGLLGDRVGLGVTWYNAVTTDALFRVPEQPVTGQGTQIRNVGEVANRGWELEGNAVVINRPNARWSVRATYNTVDNWVESMGPEGIAPGPFWIGGTYQRVCGPPNECIDGHPGQKLPVGAWLVDAPFDSNNDGHFDSSDRFFLCSDGSLGMARDADGNVVQAPCSEYATPFARNSGSLGTDLTLFNDLTINVLADWATGFYAHDWGSMWAIYNGVSRRELVEPGYEFPVRHDSDGEPIRRFGPYQAISEFMMKGDYLKLREIGTRYRVPQAWSQRIGADRASLFGSVRNVAIWSANDLIDPELNGLISGETLMLGGESSITLSPPRMFRLGLELSF